MAAKRLSLENIQADELDRKTRVEKGVAREASTPLFSIPYSNEGTHLSERIDRNDVVAAAQNRDDLVTMLLLYPVLKIKRVRLFYSSDFSKITQEFVTEYQKDIAFVAPETSA